MRQWLGKPSAESRHGEGRWLFLGANYPSGGSQLTPTTGQWPSSPPCVTKGGYLTGIVWSHCTQPGSGGKFLSVRSVTLHPFTGHAWVFCRARPKAGATEDSTQGEEAREVLMSGFPGCARCPHPEGLQGGPEDGVGCPWESPGSPVTWNCPGERWFTRGSSEAALFDLWP